MSYTLGFDLSAHNFACSCTIQSSNSLNVTKLGLDNVPQETNTANATTATYPTTTTTVDTSLNMNSHFPQPTLAAGNNPSTYDAFRNYDAHAASTSNDVRTAKPGFFRRLFHKKGSQKGTQAPKTSFVMPHERKQSQSAPAQSSVRSRPNPPTNVTDNTSNPIPVEVTVTHPSVHGRRQTLKVHTFDGDLAPAPARDNVRFSHPAVNAVRPTTPMSMSQLFNNSDEALSTNSEPPSNEPSPESSRTSLNNTLRPANVWRNSDHFKTVDGKLADFHEFKNRLDGHKLSSSGLPRASAAPEPVQFTPQRVTETPPVLQFITTVGRFTIDDEPVFDENADFSETTNVHERRNNARNMPQPAAVPRATPPPAVLTPAQFPAPLLPGQRPFSVLTTNADKAQYQAYRPAATTAAEVFATATSNVPAAPAANNDARPKTPNFDAAIPNHREHYARVESGLFDVDPKELLSNTPPPASTTPESVRIRRKQVQLKDPQAPPKPAAAPAVKPTGPPRTRGFSKPLPPTPHKMNSNRYPVIDPSVANTYNTKPVYERRSMDYIQEKLQRDVLVNEKKGRRASKAEESEKVKKSFARPVSPGTMEKMVLTGMQKEKAELEEAIAKQEVRVAERQKQKQLAAGVKKLVID